MVGSLVHLGEHVAVDAERAVEENRTVESSAGVLGSKKVEVELTHFLYFF